MYGVAYAYIGLLGALTLCVIAFGKVLGMRRTMFAILANYMLASAYTGITQDSDPWWLFMFLDVITATIILIQPAGKMQALIGWTYVAQIAMHTGYALNPNHDPVNYWWLLAISGLVQLILVGAWLGGARFHLHRLLGVVWLARPAHKKGVEG